VQHKSSAREKELKALKAHADDVNQQIQVLYDRIKHYSNEYLK
jgi:hypothetical protein